MIDLQFTEVAFASPIYAETLVLREEVLRKPLGLHFDIESLHEEYIHHHLVALNAVDQLLGCLVMVPLTDGHIKMRQVAVAESHRGKGVGSQLVKFAEFWAYASGYRAIHLNARDLAVPFYKRLNYDIISDKFVEVGIPHFKMEKKL